MRKGSNNVGRGCKKHCERNLRTRVEKKRDDEEKGKMTRRGMYKTNLAQPRGKQPVGQQTYFIQC